MEKLYTMETLAEYLGVSVRTILREKAAGKLGFKRIRGQVRFTEMDVKTYLENSSFQSVNDIALVSDQASRSNNK